jgi:cytochrome oxidase Cu insertion factor (SCO1/SenC/PrrC family)
VSLAGRAATILISAAIIGAGVGFGIHALSRGGASSATGASGDLMGQATWGPGERRAPDFTLSDQNGGPVSPASLRGQDVLLTFLGSRCLRSCPKEQRSLATSLRLLSGSARPAVVIVSLDPGAVPPELVDRAARALGLGSASSWHWLFGSPASLAAVWRSYGVGAGRGSARRRPLAYLIDPRGYERAGFLYPFPPNWLVEDIRILRGEN